LQLLQHGLSMRAQRTQSAIFSKNCLFGDCEDSTIMVLLKHAFDLTFSMVFLSNEFLSLVQIIRSLSIIDNQFNVDSRVGIFSVKHS
jgi:hypothetical protein